MMSKLNSKDKKNLLKKITPILDLCVLVLKETLLIHVEQLLDEGVKPSSTNNIDDIDITDIFDMKGSSFDMHVKGLLCEAEKIKKNYPPVGFVKKESKKK